MRLHRHGDAGYCNPVGFDSLSLMNRISPYRLLSNLHIFFLFSFLSFFIIVIRAQFFVFSSGSVNIKEKKKKMKIALTKWKESTWLMSRERDPQLDLLFAGLIVIVLDR